MDKVEMALENMSSAIELPDEIIENARKPLQRMLELAV